MAEITCIAGTPTGTEPGTVTRNIPYGTQDVRLVASTVSQAVTGTFWQATQPVSGTFWQATQPVSIAGNQATNTVQLGGTAISMNTGLRDAGTQRVTIATNDSVPVTGTFWQATQPVSGTFWQATQPVSGTVTANQGGTNWSVNHSQTNGVATVTSVTGVQDVMPRKRVGTTGLSPNYYSVRKTDKLTTTVTAATCYVQSIAYCCTGAGSAWTLQFKDKSATPLALTAAITLALSTTPVIVLNLSEPIIMTGGIDIITAGTTAGTVDIWVTYWQ